MKRFTIGNVMRNARSLFTTCCYVPHAGFNNPKNSQNKTKNIFFHLHFTVTPSFWHLHVWSVCAHFKTKKQFLAVFSSFFWSFPMLSPCFTFCPPPPVFPLIVAVNPNRPFALLLEQRVIKWLISDGRVRMF